MCSGTKLIGGSLCAFGAGVLISTFLPCGIVVVLQGVIVVAAGALVLYR